jgi:hypothetical protein
MTGFLLQLSIWRWTGARHSSALGFAEFESDFGMTEWAASVLLRPMSIDEASFRGDVAAHIEIAYFARMPQVVSPLEVERLAFSRGPQDGPWNRDMQIMSFGTHLDWRYATRRLDMQKPSVSDDAPKE